MSKSRIVALSVVGLVVSGVAGIMLFAPEQGIHTPLVHASPGTDMFLKIQGIDGESRDEVHRNEIEVLSWSWGMSQSGTQTAGGGGGAGKVNIQDLSVTKFLDKSSTKLMLAAAQGKHIPEVKLMLVRAGGERPLEYLVITMTDVRVTSLNTGGSTGEDRMTENITLNFTKMNVEYTEQKADGTPGDKGTFNWDLKKNATF